VQKINKGGELSSGENACTYEFIARLDTHASSGLATGDAP
jgi:hypothetical protein